MIKYGIVAVVALMISATTAFSFQEETSQPSVTMGIDSDTSGNTATSLGQNDACRSVSEGDSFDVDVWVKDLAPYVEDTEGGLSGYSYNLLFDPDVLHVTGYSNQFLIASNGGADALELVDGDGTEVDLDPLPGTTGNVRVDFVDLSTRIESGSGVLTRFTLQTVGSGVSSLALDETAGAVSDMPIIFGYGAQPEYNVSSVAFAQISAGQPCGEAPTPHVPGGPPLATLRPPDGGDGTSTPAVPTGPAQTPDPAASPTETPAGTVPARGTELAVDAIPTGNARTQLASVDACAAAEEGDTFIVDVVITEAQDLLAWAVPLTYDPTVLRVDDRDVQQFSAGNAGSQIVDASASTPDTSGHYSASAVDVADPPAPDTGSGVLVRLTMTAVGEGNSGLSLAPVDINGDNTPDNGVFLRNADNQVVGDTNGDTFFDDTTTDAEIRVGSDCPDPDARVVADAAASGSPSASAGPADDGGDNDGGSDALLYLAIGLVVILAAAGVAAGYYFMRGRRGVAP